MQLRHDLYKDAVDASLYRSCHAMPCSPYITLSPYIHILLDIKCPYGLLL